ncbi:hypothetical protein AXG93_3425s1010 [Marchantia polymorpha subsp. ruderalis]|uniref:Protein kinase domain-containing protein n=1 Tax=Marchantia polymorpha subsp. ruderalis TaxID=1480154 RepID=A0A176WSE4_MARPO|nr:hypothetical protein AXG93_3425s1010 [Marchantia polymorpha subsp. ruderalis]
MRGDQNSDWWKQSGGRMIKTNRRRYLVALLALSVLALLALQNYDKRRCAEKRPATGSSARLQLQSNGSDCQRICGNVSIPYPFGLTPQCAYSSYFVLDCRTDLGPNLKQPATDPFEQWPVLTHIATTSTLNYSFEVNFLPVTQITSNSILIDTTNIKDMGCGKSVTASLVLDAQSPYWISDQNVFIVVSCNAQGSAVGDGTPWSGSFNTTCGPVSCVNQFVMPYCGGYDCCVQAIGATKSLTITGGSYSTDCGFSTVLNPNSSGDYGVQTGVLIAVCLVSGIFVLLLSCLVIFFTWKMRRHSRELQNILEELAKDHVKPPFFSYEELKTATHSFSSSNELGKGGFGTVFKAELADGSVVAVKRLNPTKQSTSDFLKEMVNISGIKHRHLIQLKGCCVRDHQRMLIYEYAENKSLAEALFGSGPQCATVLNWKQRYNICLGIARGLAYLHEELQPDPKKRATMSQLVNFLMKNSNASVGVEIVNELKSQTPYMWSISEDEHNVDPYASSQGVQVESDELALMSSFATESHVSVRIVRT